MAGVPDIGIESLWTPRECASFLRLAEATLAQLRWRGGGPPYCKLNGGAVRYQPEAVREWVAAQMRVSTSDNTPGPLKPRGWR